MRVRLLMDARSPNPPRETRERLCPHCLSLAVKAVGYVVADATALRSAYRCGDCTTEFVLFRANLSTKHRSETV